MWQREMSEAVKSRDSSEIKRNAGQGDGDFSLLMFNIIICLHF